MANKLTGSYDAVAQVSRRQLNGLLASLHQNGASDQPPLRLGHNWVLRVGDPKPTTPELVRLRFRQTRIRPMAVGKKYSRRLAVDERRCRA